MKVHDFHDVARSLIQAIVRCGPHVDYLMPSSWNLKGSLWSVANIMSPHISKAQSIERWWGALVAAAANCITAAFSALLSDCSDLICSGLCCCGTAADVDVVSAS